MVTKVAYGVHVLSYPLTFLLLHVLTLVLIDAHHIIIVIVLVFLFVIAITPFHLLRFLD